MLKEVELKVKLILASNVLEHPGFTEFMRDVSSQHSNSIFAVTGDLLNVFPEPGEDIQGSICHELFGEIVETGLNALIESRFRDVDQSALVPMLKEVFYPHGKHFDDAKKIARARYRRLFQGFEKALRFKESAYPAFIYIPGNMDYPDQAAVEIADSRLFRQIDCEVIQIDGVKIGALGGIPNSTHPFSGIAEISPYEMHVKEYERRLEMLWGVDVLMTHLSPAESPSIDRFLRESPLKLLICRAPFDFQRKADFRGALELVSHYEKTVLMVRPFDYPKNSYFVVDLQGGFDPSRIQRHIWTAQPRPEMDLECVPNGITEQILPL